MKILLATEPENLFTYKEFGTYLKEGKIDMDSVLLYKLTLMQNLMGYNLKINSGYRNHSRNAQAGGVENSAHITKDAVDIRCLDSRYRYELVRQAILSGFNRIGIHSRFIHLDVDTSKQQNVIWLY